MYIYLTFYALIVLLGIKIDNSPKYANKRFYLFLIFALLICFSVFRQDLGTDIGRYTRDYETVYNLPWFSIISGFDAIPYDFLFSLLYVVFGNILKLDFWSIKLFISLIFCFGFYKFSKKIDNFALSAIIFVPVLYYFISFSLLRQSISICLGLYVVTLIMERKYSLSYLITLIGLLFHKYFFIFFIIIILNFVISNPKNFKKMFKYLLILFFSVLLFALFYNYALRGHYNWYVISSPSNHELQYPFLKLLFLNYSYFIIFYFISLSNFKNFNLEDRLIFIFILFGILFLIVYPFSNIVTLRFMMYFIVINPLIIMKLMKFLNNKADNIILILLFLLHSAYMVFFFNFSTHKGSFIPYKLYFF